MRSVRKPWWQQATALVTVSTGGVITGFNFVPGAAATMTSPASVPLHLLALDQAARPGVPGDLAVGAGSAGRVTSDAQLRAAIVNVARYYLQLAKTKTPAQMEALIWDNTSSDGADHGPSCAAFASLALELAAQTVGLRSWVTGGTTYPWPEPAWADVRVDTNPDSPAITSMVADAQAHGRWHPLGDGYRPQAGDWALYDGHVEVVTSYSGGVLDTIGADSLPGFTVNAHSSGAPLAEQGVTGFIDNGNLRPSGASAATAAADPVSAPAARPDAPARNPSGPSGAASNVKAAPPPLAAAERGAAVPGLPGAAALSGKGGIPGAGAGPSSGDARAKAHPAASVPGLPAPASSAASGHHQGTADIPGAGGTAVTAPTGSAPGAHAASPSPSAHPAAPSAHPASPPNARPAPTAKPVTPHPAPSAAPVTPHPAPSAAHSGSSGRQYTTPGTRTQQAFISMVAPGAVAAQQRYGVPAAVTIAQAIEESAWGQSSLAARYHNLFGIKGTGPAGSVTLPTSEFEGGRRVTVDARFRVYHNDAESIADHAELLATSGYYTRAMADRAVPDAFANDLTGVYATDPHYGASLIALMKLYNLYQYDAAPAHAPAAHQAPAPTASPAAPRAPAAPSPASAPASHQAKHPDHGKASTPAGDSAARAAGAPASRAGTGSASVPGVTAPALAPDAPGHAVTSAPPEAGRTAAGRIPGLVSPGPATSGAAPPAHVTPAQRPAVKKGAPAGSPAASRGSAAGSASIPGLGAPGPGSGPGPSASKARTSGPAAAAARRGGTRSPGMVTAAYATRAQVTTGRPGTGNAATGHVTAGHATAGRAGTGAAWYEPRLPQAVTTALFANAKGPLARGEHLYRDVAAGTDVSWKLLAAVDWMQCKADPRFSPVAGEKLGALNDDGTSYPTKSAALSQCARDLVELAAAVYGIDLTARRPLSVRELAAAFAAFRWGAILRRHGVSPMEFPYSVAGLTAAHQKMHWPSVDAPDAPDRPGSRFREQFGAVPVVLNLGYPAIVS